MFETDKKDLQYAPKGPIFEDNLNKKKLHQFTGNSLFYESTST